jgi:hypothetical protein
LLPAFVNDVLAPRTAAVTRLAFKIGTVRALFARSGNRCSFPGCTAPLVNERNQFVAQVCHIEAAEVGGERYNPDQTDEMRHHYDNLILLCYPHHVETDEVALYPVPRMQEIKSMHEAAFAKNEFKIDESLLYKITHEMTEYWQQVDELHHFHHVIADLAIPIDVSSSYPSLARDAYGLIDKLRRYRDDIGAGDRGLQETIPKFLARVDAGALCGDDYIRELYVLANPNWEVLNLGMNNALSELSVRLVQMELRFLEEFLKTNGNDMPARRRLEQLKNEFADLATRSGYVD